MYSAIDVLIVPSLWYENTPIVIAEAFAAGRPVIGSDVDGIRDSVTHEHNGLLFPRGDDVSLEQNLRRVLVEPHLLERLRNGIPPVRTTDDEVESLVRLYSEQLTGRSDPSAHRSRRSNR